MSAHPDTAHTLANGITGTAATVLGVLTSFQENLDYYLRIGSLCIGILVGLVTLYNLLKRKKPPQ